MQPIPDARLTCISNFGLVTYSGMLPGVLSGQYAPERMQVDLVRLCAAGHARLILADAVGLDLQLGQLLLMDRPAIPFDVLSIGIGSIPGTSGAEIDSDIVFAVKPMQTFLQRVAVHLEKLRQTVVSRPLRITVVGAGAGGVEITFCLPHFVQRVLGATPIEMSLIDSHDRVIQGVNDRTAGLARRSLEGNGVKLALMRRVKSVRGETVTLDNGETLTADLIIWATGATAPPLLGKLSLPTDPRGFVLTKPTLQSVADDRIFAVGDSGTIVDQSLPKAGVFAVRQGPVLWTNIQRLLSGERPIPYKPQRSFLKLFNTADGEAIGEFKGVSLKSKWCWRLKDRIDSRFMDKYQAYEPMPLNTRAAAPEPTFPMRCAGCGGKVSGSVLSRALARLKIPEDEHVLSGLNAAEDVALIHPPKRPLALTVDFFAAPLDDPYLVGRLSALNAASDIYASGAEPRVALAMATIPVGPARKQEDLLYELLSGGLYEFTRMHATIVGGHTLEGPQLTIGFSMMAEQVSHKPRTKAGLKLGDVLVLTKPLGIGVLLAAHMQASCQAEWMESLLSVMLHSNQSAAEMLDEFSVAGATDVTGFGLAGHLLEMLRASQLGAEIRLDAIPLLEGAKQLFQSGLESTLAPANRSVESEIQVAARFREKPVYRALFDPQTCGGLLLGVPQSQVDTLISRLRSQSDIPVAVIGRVIESSGEGRLHVRGTA